MSASSVGPSCDDSALALDPCNAATKFEALVAPARKNKEGLEAAVVQEAARRIGEFRTFGRALYDAWYLLLSGIGRAHEPGQATGHAFF